MHNDFRAFFVAFVSVVVLCNVENYPKPLLIDAFDLWIDRGKSLLF